MECCDVLDDPTFSRTSCVFLYFFADWQHPQYNCTYAPMLLSPRSLVQPHGLPMGPHGDSPLAWPVPDLSSKANKSIEGYLADSADSLPTHMCLAIPANVRNIARSTAGSESRGERLAAEHLGAGTSDTPKKQHTLAIREDTVVFDCPWRHDNNTAV
jgi:hypothetical protein